MFGGRFLLPGLGPTTPFSFSGRGRHLLRFDQNAAYQNHHAGASYIKMLANLIVQHSTQYAFTRLCDSWEDDTSDPNLPSVAYTIYHDDIITPELVATLMRANIPLLAVMSIDPKRPYSVGGIDYTYDPTTCVYTGYSAGKTIPHTYTASHYAQYAYYVDATTRMFVVAEFCGQRLVYFEPPG